ncbi:sulfatase family protein [Aureliella helgolandensis]|uniref:Arylsulfatase n=1 Tax=Aureliella helgolandensis TaxID=2527968 RepID=A0A518GGS3_9BACT|nr:sulfatase [Aureliella helgolandensis]QDV27780.1 Arylsulfatase precursor [Aureliella helgolandensis]
MNFHKCSTLLLALQAVLAALFAPNTVLATAPNVVVIFCDDLGYGDLSSFGHPSINTPRLDQMATEGMRWKNFYSAAPVCTPSRAALLTGRLPLRNGMCSNTRRVLFPDSTGGLPDSEITLAEMLRSSGYRTGCVGKWHLGHLPQFSPLQHGFDSYFGIPYSNDMDRTGDAPRGRHAIFEPETEYFNVPLLRDREILEQPADQTTITRRYTEEAIQFIQTPSEQPFFLYLAHSMPHVPLFRSPAFEGHSRRGLYGDVIEEIDWSVGQVLDAIRDSNLAENTLVIFTSDNGPWLSQDAHGGSAGLLREGKGTTWEGGMREPTIMWWPGTIEAGQATAAMGCTTDLLATCATLSGGQLPTDRVIDSVDLTPVLHDATANTRNELFYYRAYELMAVRMGPWKVHFQEQGSYGTEPKKLTKCAPPKLYHLEHDPSERYNIAQNYPEIVAQVEQLVEEHRKTLVPAPSQLENKP